MDKKKNNIERDIKKTKQSIKIFTASEWRTSYKQKKEIVKPKGKKLSGKTFVKISDTAIITEDTNQRPVFEQNIRTYKVTRIKNKFIIYEMRRKQKPLRLKTIKARKGQKINDIILKAQHDKIKLREKNITFKNSKLTIIQTNYKARIKSRPQLLGLVNVIDIRRMISDYFIGYSYKINNSFPTKQEIRKAKDEIIKVAESKFYSIYGSPLNSGDMRSVLMTVRYQYYRKPKHIK